VEKTLTVIVREKVCNNAQKRKKPRFFNFGILKKKKQRKIRIAEHCR